MNALLEKQGWFVTWMMLVHLTLVELLMLYAKQVSSMAPTNVAAQQGSRDIIVMRMSMSAKKVRLFIVKCYRILEKWLLLFDN